MKIVNLKQRTPEWYNWRLNGIGASDVPILTGNSPYLTKNELLLQKKGIKKPTKLSEHLVKISNKVESDAIDYFCKVRNIFFEPLCAEHKENCLLKASLDGWNEDHGILECKYVSAKYFQELKEKGDIRSDHQDQIQFQMLITGKSYAHYYVQNSREEHLILILEEDKVYQNKLIKLAEDFLTELNIGLNGFQEFRDIGIS